jgi:hypothetical protein
MSKKQQKNKDWDDVYMDMVSKMKKNSKNFPNAISIEEEDRLLKEKRKKRKKGGFYMPGLYGHDHGFSDFGGGDAGGD